MTDRTHLIRMQKDLVSEEENVWGIIKRLGKRCSLLSITCNSHFLTLFKKLRIGNNLLPLHNKLLLERFHTRPSHKLLGLTGSRRPFCSIPIITITFITIIIIISTPIPTWITSKAWNWSCGTHTPLHLLQHKRHPSSPPSTFPSKTAQRIKRVNLPHTTMASTENKRHPLPQKWSSTTSTPPSTPHLEHAKNKNLKRSSTLNKHYLAQ